jgi:hypothetical protein
MLRAGAVASMAAHLALITQNGDRSPLSRCRPRRAAGMRTAAPARPCGSLTWPDCTLPVQTIAYGLVARRAAVGSANAEGPRYRPWS